MLIDRCIGVLPRYFSGPDSPVKAKTFRFRSELKVIGCKDSTSWQRHVAGNARAARTHAVHILFRIFISLYGRDQHICKTWA